MIFGRPVSFLQASHLSLVCWTLVGQDKCWSYEIKWDVCCIHILEIISDFCGWPFVRSFALCYDHCHCGQGARGWSAQIWPQLKSGHCGSPCIKPSWTPLAPFVQEPGHWATIYNINFTFGEVAPWLFREVVPFCVNISIFHLWIDRSHFTDNRAASLAVLRLLGPSSWSAPYLTQFPLSYTAR